MKKEDMVEWDELLNDPEIRKEAESKTKELFKTLASVQPIDNVDFVKSWRAMGRSTTS